MKMDLQTKKFLDDFNALQLPPFEQQSIEAIRNSPGFFGYKSDAPIAEVKNITINGSLGKILLRIYIPHGSGPFPVFVTFHGGAWIAGNLENHDALCREICNQSCCVVVSVDYRLAPEHKFPEPLQDCYDATVWAAGDEIKKYKGDPTKIAVGGDSAGGNLAAAVALMARDKGKPTIKAQALIYPVLDHNFETKSYNQFAENYFLTKSSMKWFWNQYLRSAADATNAYAAPLQAKDFKQLPATFIVVGSFDPLHDEGVAFGEKLKAAQVPVEVKEYATIHAFVSFADKLDVGKQATTDVVEFLKRIV